MTATLPFPPAVIDATAHEIWFCLVGSQVPGLRWEHCAEETRKWFRTVAAAALAKAEAGR